MYGWCLVFGARIHGLNLDSPYGTELTQTFMREKVDYLEFVKRCYYSDVTWANEL